MEIRWLEAFVAVAEELHFGRAAARLRLAQSPLSQTIRKLERELGVTLFDRSTRSVALTPAGQALLPHAHRVFEELELGRQATGAASGVFYGTVDIGFAGALNHLTLPPLTRAVRHRYPDVTLNLVGRVMTRDGVARVERGALDLAFVALPLDPSPVVRTRLIAREPLGVVLPVDHRLAGEPVVDLADLADDGFVTTPVAVGSGLQEAGLRACVNAGFRPRIVQEITDPFMILTLVAAGVGVALVSAEVAGIMPSGSVYVPLRGKPVHLDHAIAWSADNPSTVLKAVLAVAEEVLPTPA
ncbi:MAG: LysR family transcriptional regulator [Pseudonocardia sp.]|nr:LysR family transcriptional regulator [Pseudonocardia sp.]